MPVDNYLNNSLQLFVKFLLYFLFFCDKIYFNNMRIPSRTSLKSKFSWFLLCTLTAQLILTISQFPPTLPAGSVGGNVLNLS